MQTEEGRECDDFLESQAASRCSCCLFFHHIGAAVSDCGSLGVGSGLGGEGWAREGRERRGGAEGELRGDNWRYAYLARSRQPQARHKQMEKGSHTHAPLHTAAHTP